MRIVLDTNVLVSGLAYPASIPGLILQEWDRGGLKIVLSRYILAEMVRVLPKLPPVKLDASEIRDLADSFMLRAEIVDAATVGETMLRDPKDQPILDTLMASKADYLVTGDKDFLALKTSYPIVTPAEFWARHGA